MADKKAGAYGAKGGGGDTDFRRTFDREDYKRRAEVRAAEEKEEGRKRYEAKLEGKTYRKRASTPEDVRMTTARESRIDVASRIGTVQLVTSGGVGRKSGVGFTCEICPNAPVSFFSSIEYIEHCNSPVHVQAQGLSMSVQRATVEDVHERLRWLSRKRKEASRVEVLDLDQRLGERIEEEEREREEKRRKRNEKRRSKKQQEDW